MMQTCCLRLIIFLTSETPGTKVGDIPCCCGALDFIYVDVAIVFAFVQKRVSFLKPVNPQQASSSSEVMAQNLDSCPSISLTPVRGTPSIETCWAIIEELSLAPTRLGGVPSCPKSLSPKHHTPPTIALLMSSAMTQVDKMLATTWRTLRCDTVAISCAVAVYSLPAPSCPNLLSPQQYRAFAEMEFCMAQAWVPPADMSEMLTSSAPSSVRMLLSEVDVPLVVSVSEAPQHLTCPPSMAHANP